MGRTLQRALLVLVCGLVASGARAEGAPPRSLSLDEARQELEAHSLTLAQARARTEQALGVVRQATAALLPTLQATGSFTRNSDAATAPLGTILAGRLPPGTPAPADLVIQPLELWNATGALRVPLVEPSAWAERAQARHGAESAAAAADAVRRQLRATLVQLAWNATAGEEIEAAADRALESAREQARSAERSLQAGTGTPLALLQARTEAVRRESELAAARADLARARLALGVLLGRAEPVRVSLPDPAAPLELDPAALAAAAVEQRPEMHGAREQVSAAERQLDAARLRLLPRLAATASGFAQDQPAPTGKETGWRATVELSWALYDGGFRYGRWRQAEGAVAEASAAAEAQRLAIAQEVADAARDVGVSRERLRLAEEQRRLAAEAAATARRGFAGGIASSLDVLDANDRLYQSDVGLAAARARLGSALAALDRAAGRG